MPQFEMKLVYLGDQGMEFANQEGKQVKMLKTRWGAMGELTVWDFNIMINDEASERLCQRLSELPQYSPVECLLNMTASKDLKPSVKLLDVVSNGNSLKPKQGQQ